MHSVSGVLPPQLPRRQAKMVWVAKMINSEELLIGLTFPVLASN
jgi:hypothetical protein